MIDNSEDFKNAVKVYVELHDEIATASKHLNELRKKKDALGELIIKFMKQSDLDVCQLQDGSVLERRESKRTEPLKKEHILGEIMALVGQDSARANECLENMMKKRDVASKDVLARKKTS